MLIRNVLQLLVYHPLLAAVPSPSSMGIIDRVRKLNWLSKSWWLMDLCCRKQPLCHLYPSECSSSLPKFLIVLIEVFFVYFFKDFLSHSETWYLISPCRPELCSSYSRKSCLTVQLDGWCLRTGLCWNIFNTLQFTICRVVMQDSNDVFIKRFWF